MNRHSWIEEEEANKVKPYKQDCSSFCFIRADGQFLDAHISSAVPLTDSLELNKKQVQSACLVSMDDGNAQPKRKGGGLNNVCPLVILTPER